MKRSEMYKAAQYAVLKSEDCTADEKLEIIGVLMEDEKLARFSEERKEREAQQ